MSCFAVSVMDANLEHLPEDTTTTTTTTVASTVASSVASTVASTVSTTVAGPTTPLSTLVNLTILLEGAGLKAEDGLPPYLGYLVVGLAFFLVGLVAAMCVCGECLGCWVAPICCAASWMKRCCCCCCRYVFFYTDEALAAAGLSRRWCCPTFPGPGLSGVWRRWWTWVARCFGRKRSRSERCEECGQGEATTPSQRSPPEVRVEDETPKKSPGTPKKRSLFSMPYSSDPEESPSKKGPVLRSRKSVRPVSKIVADLEAAGPSPPKLKSQVGPPSEGLTKPVYLADSKAQLNEPRKARRVKRQAPPRPDKPPRLLEAEESVVVEEVPAWTFEDPSGRSLLDVAWLFRGNFTKDQYVTLSEMLVILEQACRNGGQATAAVIRDGYTLGDVLRLDSLLDALWDQGETDKEMLGCFRRHLAGQDHQARGPVADERFASFPRSPEVVAPEMTEDEESVASQAAGSRWTPWAQMVLMGAVLYDIASQYFTSGGS